MEDLKEAVEEVRLRMDNLGFRPVQKSDLTSGKNLVMIQIQKFKREKKDLPSVGIVGETKIVISEIPIQTPSVGERMVSFHCLSVEWNRDHFVSVDDLVRDEYTDQNPQGNNVRYFISR